MHARRIPASSILGRVETNLAAYDHLKKDATFAQALEWITGLESKCREIRDVTSPVRNALMHTVVADFEGLMFEATNNLNNACTEGLHSMEDVRTLVKVRRVFRAAST